MTQLLQSELVLDSLSCHDDLVSSVNPSKSSNTKQPGFTADQDPYCSIWPHFVLLPWCITGMHIQIKIQGRNVKVTMAMQLYLQVDIKVCGNVALQQKKNALLKWNEFCSGDLPSN